MSKNKIDAAHRSLPASVGDTSSWNEVQTAALRKMTKEELAAMVSQDDLIELVLSTRRPRSKPETTSTMSIQVAPDQVKRIMYQVHPDHQIEPAALRLTCDLLNKTGTALVSKGVTNADTMGGIACLDHACRRPPGLQSSCTDVAKYAERKWLENTEKNTGSLLVKMVLPSDYPRNFTAASLAGLVFDTGGTVAINAVLEQICAEILTDAGNVAMDRHKKRIHVYDILTGIAYSDPLMKVFRALGVETGASTCLELPAPSKERKIPNFDPRGCYLADERRKKGHADKTTTYEVTEGPNRTYRWTKVK